jgi:hypothetical protein
MLAVSAALAALATFNGATAGGDGDRDDTVAVELMAVSPDAQAAELSPVLDLLVDGDVLDVSMIDGAEGAQGSVRQCVRTLRGFRACTNHYPVRFDDNGRARFQYRLDDPGDCGPDGSCALVVDDRDGQRQASAVLIFGAPAPPPPAVEISPSELVEQGDRLQVDVAGLLPDAEVRVGYCDPECTAATRIVADGSGRASHTVVAGAPCDECGVAVIAGPHETFIPVSFSPLVTPGYDPRRLAIGLVVAAVLLATAWRIVTAVDWRPPSEADTPDLDMAEL